MSTANHESPCGNPDDDGAVVNGWVAYAVWV